VSPKVTESRSEFYAIIPGTTPMGLINPSPIGPRGFPPLIDPRGFPPLIDPRGPPSLRLPRLLGTPPTVLSTELPLRVLLETSPGTIPARSTACQVWTGVASAREIVAATWTTRKTDSLLSIARKIKAGVMDPATFYTPGWTTSSRTAKRQTGFCIGTNQLNKHGLSRCIWSSFSSSHLDVEVVRQPESRRIGVEDNFISG